MVGYRNEKYENFGNFSAILDDVVNYVPSRLTSIIIVLLFFKLQIIKKIFAYGKLHESPNAGYPISALGFCIDVKLGGDTSYFGKIKHKPSFSEGKEEISKDVTVELMTGGQENVSESVKETKKDKESTNDSDVSTNKTKSDLETDYAMINFPSFYRNVKNKYN